MENKKAFLLRITPDLWAALEEWAQQELRSVNGQIEYILRQAVLKRKGPGGDKRTKGAESATPAREERGA